MRRAGALAGAWAGGGVHFVHLLPLAGREKFQISKNKELQGENSNTVHSGEWPACIPYGPNPYEYDPMTL